QLLSFLARRHALLALDNVEQIPDLAPVVAGLLDAAPALKILATSRALLRVSGEHEFAVSPLSGPSTKSTRLTGGGRGRTDARRGGVCAGPRRRDGGGYSSRPSPAPPPSRGRPNSRNGGP